MGRSCKPAPLEISNCHCKGEECPTYVSRQRLTKLGPRLAVEAAASESPDSPFMQELVSATLKDPRYRFYGASELYIRQILEGQSYDTSQPHWEQPVRGILNVFKSISKSRLNLPEDAAIHRELYSSYQSIIDVIFRDMAYLAIAGPEADERRSVVCEMIGWFYHEWHIDPSKKSKYYDKKTAKIIIRCWLSTPPDSPSLDQVVRTLEIFFPLPPDPSGQRPSHLLEPEYRQVAFDSFKVTTIVSQLNFIFKHKNLTLASLNNEIIAAGTFLNQPFLPYILESKVAKQVIAAVRKQFKEHEHRNCEELQILIDNCGYFVEGLFQDSATQVAICTELLATTHLIEVGVEALKLAHSSHTYEPKFWPHLFKQMEHCITCDHDEGCDARPTPSYLAAARSALARVAVPTLVALHPQTAVCSTRDRTRFFLCWNSLISSLGINEDTIRERHRTDRKCCNLRCPSRNFGAESNKKSTCMRCKSVFYCNRECQKSYNPDGGKISSDWLIHRAECQKLAGAFLLSNTPQRLAICN
ncbi:hypothetical protein CVT26_009196 [Gymnopilus dilepis]|uniref:MYND-type domain-containing protein n=1 Tax=Gymnopilus dilepis TaxID=231916 RepID=A0A409Y971_9AGAR|nr:hypothetical protein CVT26_009196 [Gymnopilus dilepis]